MKYDKPEVRLDTKHNLTIIDKNPEIKNFVYAGVGSSVIDKIKHDFKNQIPVIEFSYDEGDVLVTTSEIHTLVISEYINPQDLDEPLEDDV